MLRKKFYGIPSRSMQILWLVTERECQAWPKYSEGNRKAELKGKLEAFERNRKNRFEPAIRFVLEAKNATFLLAQGKPEQKRDFLKKSVRTFMWRRNR